MLAAASAAPPVVPAISLSNQAPTSAMISASASCPRRGWRAREVPPAIPRATLGIYADADECVKAAGRGFEANERLPVATRAKMIEAMRQVTFANNESCRGSRSRRPAGALRGQARQEQADRRQDAGLRDPAADRVHWRRRPDADRAAPYGVILEVTPTTNPTETILCNAIGMVFNVIRGHSLDNNIVCIAEKELAMADAQVWPMLGAPVTPPDWTADDSAEAVAIVETATVCGAIWAAMRRARWRTWWSAMCGW